MWKQQAWGYLRLLHRAYSKADMLQVMPLASFTAAPPTTLPAAKALSHCYPEEELEQLA